MTDQSKSDRQNEDGLLPCPFCGSPSLYDGMKCAAVCTNQIRCGIRGPMRYDRSAGIECWNTRTQPARDATKGATLSHHANESLEEQEYLLAKSAPPKPATDAIRARTTSVLSALASIADKYSDSEDDSHKLFTDWDKEPNQSLTLGVCRDARALLASSAFAAAPDAMREALAALQEMPLSEQHKIVLSGKIVSDWDNHYREGFEAGKLAAPIPPADGASVLETVDAVIDQFENDTRVLYPDSEVLMALGKIRDAVSPPSGTGAAEPVASEHGVECRLCGETLHDDERCDHFDCPASGERVIATPPVKGDREAIVKILEKYDRPRLHHAEIADVILFLPVQPGAGEREHHKLDNERRVFFYEQDFYVLSNFSAFTLLWRGIRFQTSEQAYHWEKFLSEQPGLKFHRDTIHSATSAHEAFKYAEQNKQHRRPDWDSVKIGIMRDILRAKAEQHEYVRRKLLATGDRELIEDSWRDDFWGWGPNRNGRNVLGKIWMEIRDELRSRQAPHSGDGEVHDQ